MSNLLMEDEEWLYLQEWLHNSNDSFSSWELNENGGTKYDDIVHRAEHYALYEVEARYKINKKTGAIINLSFV